MKIAAIPTRTSVYWNSEEYVTNSIPWNTPLAGAEKIFHPRVCYGGQPSVTGSTLPYSSHSIPYYIIVRNSFPFGPVPVSSPVDKPSPGNYTVKAIQRK